MMIWRLSPLLGLCFLMGLTPLQTGAVGLPAGATLPLPFPAGANIRISSGYSPSGGSSLHDGVTRTGSANDYYALDLVYNDKPDNGLGEPVAAPFAGTVVRAGWASEGWANYGLRVILSHDLGDGQTYHSLYAHLNAIDDAITEGATVARGQVLGELGRSCQNALSCNSFSSPHVHFSIHQNSSIGGSGTGGSYGGVAVRPEPLDGVEDLSPGLVITSSNVLQEVCGDGYCSAGEDNSSCADDCPICEAVGPGGRIIDDTDICFSRGGNGAYWYQESAGHDGHLWWTHTTDASDIDNHGIWALDMESAGTYQVEVYIDGDWGQSQDATYFITHGGAQSEAVLDQSGVDGWASLGIFNFTAGGGQQVQLNDNTGEAFGLSRQIVFDAIRLSPAATEDGGASNPPDGGSLDAGEVVGVDGGGMGEVPDAGEAGQDNPDAGADGSGDEGNGDPDPDEMSDVSLAPASGCACASESNGGGDDPLGWMAALGLLSVGFLLRRKKRAQDKRKDGLTI